MTIALQSKARRQDEKNDKVRKKLRTRGSGE